jgi:adenylylsulfate kinase
MAEPKGTHLTKHKGEVDRTQRRRAHGHRGATVWMTGLSGSGKSTVAYRVERQLLERGCFAYVLDGDNVRHGLCADLTFSPEDRAENIRRIGEVAKLFTDAGALLIASFISPYRRDRDRIRAGMIEGDFVEVHVATPIEVCEQRDPKGLYAKARAGEIPNFTGVGAPYEPPESPEIVIDTAKDDVDACASQVVAWLEQHGYLRAA